MCAMQKYIETYITTFYNDPNFIPGRLERQIEFTNDKLLVLENIPKQTEHICKKMVSYNYEELECVIKQNKDICEEAVKSNGAAILYVDAQFLTLELYEMAMTNEVFWARDAFNKVEHYDRHDKNRLSFIKNTKVRKEYEKYFL